MPSRWRVHALRGTTNRTSGRALGRALASSLLAASLLAIAPAPTALAAAQAGEPAGVDFASLAEADQVRLLIVMARDGRHELAARIIAAHPLQGPHGRNRTLFIEGLVLKARGDREGAVAKFRAALADDPGLTLVRAELSQTLYEMGDDEAAKHHLELLMGAAPTAEDARNIKSFIDTIDARRPLKASAYVSIAPSTNINNGTTNDVIYIGGLPFVINDDSKKKSGIGIAAGANVAYTAPLDERLQAIVAGGVHAVQYEGDDYDQLSLSQTIELRRRTMAGHVGAGILATQSLDGGFSDVADLSQFGGDLSAWALGPRVTYFRGFGPALAFNGDVTVLRREYADLEDPNCTPSPADDCETASGYNGWSTAIEGRLSRVFSTDFTGFVSAGLERYKTDDRDDLDYWDGFAGAGLYKELTLGISATAEAELHRRVYDGDFPLQDEAREDTRVVTTVSLWKRDWNFMGYAPAVEYGFTWNDSNIPYYEYTEHSLDLRLTKEF